MKFKTTPYHSDLLNDTERLAGFYEAIRKNNSKSGVAYDLGCGSGVLSYFLTSYFEEIFSLEIEPKAANCAKENLADFSNVTVINKDVLDYEFPKKADLIVCEMLDTALIDEEEVPVLNHARKFLNEGGKIIPQGIINIAELVNMERENVHWDEDGAKYEILSDSVTYSQIDFLEDIDPDFEVNIIFKANKNGIANGIKITTVTKLDDDIICGPTPMLNPPLLIPLDERPVNSDDFIKVKIKYIMGKGIESIQSEYI